jgi:integral membrane protein
MLRLFRTPIGRLRIIGYLEGISLILLVFVAMPLKYILGQPEMVRIIGSIHGMLFTLFVFITLSVAVTYKWTFSSVTWKLLVACMLPFGTFYIDRHILVPLARIHEEND